ncbi:MAG TPA: SPFH domain-containing protein [Rhizomicrobium sp.]|nr:SPFH domain-containing protein [Rhizomicrobium sp.]
MKNEIRNGSPKSGDDGLGTPGLEMVLGYTFLAAGLSLPIAAIWSSQFSALQIQILFEASASCLIAAAAFLSCALLAQARRRGPRERVTFVRRGAKPLAAPLQWLRKQSDALRSTIANIDWRADWAPPLVSILLGAFAAWLVLEAWPAAVAAGSPLSYQVLGCSLIVAAFPVLVMERHYANLTAAEMPDAAHLARLCRVPLAAFVALGTAAVLSSLGLAWPRYIADAVAIVIGLVAAEIVLRSAVYVFVPLPPLDQRRSSADSTIAGFIRFERPRFSAITVAVRQRFGIDLSRSWALAFVRRAALSVVLGTIAFAWLLSGVTALGLGQRAVYEEIGVPKAVFHPGLHVHLPWPFGILRPVEYGAVHEIPIVFGREGPISVESASPGTPAAASGNIEGVPPPTADRLWDYAHPAEVSYLIASNANGRQNFQIVDIDLRIVYRVGLSDEAAMDAVYHVEAPEALIRVAAGRMLVQHFARYTLADVLGQNRETFVESFKTQLQARLDALSTGVEIIAIVVEAIHPPAGAARAYHRVQAATIHSIAEIAFSKADATRVLKAADALAEKTRNDAAAEAAERVDEAQAAATLFAGDRQAYAQGGQAFLFERWLSHAAKGLHAPSLVIVDHRLGGANTPTVDLRPQNGAGSPPYIDSDK